VKLEGPVYVPTEQFLATILRWSGGWQSPGRIAKENGSDKIGNNAIMYKSLLAAIAIE